MLHERKLIIFRAKKDGCILCKSMYNLQLHHIDPDSKLFAIGDYDRFTMSIEILEAEIAKCVPLCSQCHHLIHRDGKVPSIFRTRNCSGI